ncbi:acyl-CoA synthetase [Undibacterium sp.]|jgi:predicted LPLAT superfamily acyltransferase|uniref:LpxL/LpxP family acyltransferase n=1 Tax=Undibacterium sp. TaxID=1914977 RepID=UPI002C5DD0D8|nr:acyl-CoA synthetase [Undibacterium sp.]HTD06379.1 acyl-CoA synthetase [Undibacterium sp.]
MSNHKNWLDQSERGSLLAMKILAWVTLKFGRAFGRIFLYPICLYFILFSLEARRSSVDYLRRVLPRAPRWRDVLRHYHTFASTIHDRLYMLTGQYHYFDVQVHGYKEVEAYMRGRGCILMGSHLGSFEVLRTLGMFKQSLPINVLMHEGNANKINRVLNELNPAMKPKIIAMGQPDTLLKVHDCIERKEIVGMLGDRTFTSEKRVVCDFLGGKITLPQGPLAVAAILDVPIVLFFGLYRGGKRYDLHFELFEASPAVERGLRNARINEWAQRYANRLEHYCRLAPYNWFNFYHYWNE